MMEDPTRPRSNSPAGGNNEECLAPAFSLARSVCGENLIGIGVFGSWARGDVTDGSDIDLLIVVEDCLALTRELYRRWDRSPVEADGKEVQPFFVHLPQSILA